MTKAPPSAADERYVGYLAVDPAVWTNGADPVRGWDCDPAVCVNRNKVRTEPRRNLVSQGQQQIKDGQSGVLIQVILCGGRS